jgi:hypothetical protein
MKENKEMKMKKVGLIVTVMWMVILVPLTLTFSATKKTSSGSVEKTAHGRIELGGNIDFDHQSFDGGSASGLTIAPRVGYFIKPKWELEPTLLFSHSSYGDFSYSSVGLLCDVAYHFEKNKDAQYLPYVIGGLGFQSYSGDVGDNDNTSLIFPHLGGGIKYFFTNTALIRTELYFEHVTNSGGAKDADANDFGLTAGVSIFIK